MEKDQQSIAGIVVILWMATCLFNYLLLGADITQLHFSDPDDYMRIVQVLSWLDGASWYDMSQPRMNPPTGVEMHWTRFPDIPIAAMMTLTQNLVGRELSIVIVSFVVPAFLLLGLMFAACWSARPIISHSSIPNVVLAIILALPLLAKFGPGKLDHHNWQLLFAILALGCVLRIIINPQAFAPAYISGIIGALSLWVGIEALPWLVAFCMAMLIAWIFWDRRVLTASVLFSIVLLLTTIFILFLTREFGDWKTIECDSFSIAYIGIAGAIFIFWAGIWIYPIKTGNIKFRLLVAVISAAVSFLFLATQFPECISHPYSQLDANVATIWASISEVRSLLEFANAGAYQIPYFIFLPVLGLFIVIYRILNLSGNMCLVWVVIALHLFIAIALSFYQIRFLPLAHLYAVLPVAWLLSLAFCKIEERWVGIPRILLIVLALLAIGPIPSFVPVALFAPDDIEDEEEHCNIDNIEKLLDEIPDQKLIATFVALGSEILFRTGHSVLGSTYHRNTDGNLYIYNLFTAKNDQNVYKLVTDRNVNMILVCSGSPELELYTDGDGNTFVERLVAGDIPLWLEKVQVPDGSNELLFRVSNDGKM